MNERVREALQDPVFEQVYDRLRAMARRERHRVSADDSINTTMLVHEAYLGIRDAMGAMPVRDYFGYAARAMRNLLIDHARRCLRPKHGAGLQRIDIDATAGNDVRVDAAQAIELDSALQQLSKIDPRAASVVELHFFAGLDLDRIAGLLDVSERTVNRDWRFAKAWLQRELAG